MRPPVLQLCLWLLLLLFGAGAPSRALGKASIGPKTAVPEFFPLILTDAGENPPQPLERVRETESGSFDCVPDVEDGPNLYAYVNQNPWSAFDPEGLDLQPIGVPRHNAPPPVGPLMGFFSGHHYAMMAARGYTVSPDVMRMQRLRVNGTKAVLAVPPVAAPVVVSAIYAAPAVAAAPEALVAWAYSKAPLATTAVITTLTVMEETGQLDLPVPIPRLPGSGGKCFPAGTPVQTLQGMAPIESIRPGDVVWTCSQEGGEFAACEVTKVFTHEHTGEFVTITLSGGGGVTSTGNHPFRILAGEALSSRPSATDAGSDAVKASPTGARWVAATDLRCGDLTWTTSGPQSISKITRQFRSSTVYNLGVAHEHTYLVGADGILVHNKTMGDDLGGGGAPSPAPSTQKIVADAEEAALKGSGGPGKVYEIPGEELKSGLPYVGKTKQPTVADRMKNKDHRAKTPTGDPPKAKTLAEDLTEEEMAGVEALLIQQRGLDNLSNKIPGLNPSLPKNQPKLEAGKKVLEQE